MKVLPYAAELQEAGSLNTAKVQEEGSPIYC